MCLLTAGEAEGGATLAEHIQGLISPQVRRALNSMLTVGRGAPSEALVVLNIAAQLVLLQLLLILIRADPPYDCPGHLCGCQACQSESALALKAHANHRLGHAHMLMGITALCLQKDSTCRSVMHNSVRQACTNTSYIVACSAVS